MIACLDLEGVLLPEIWIKFSEKSGIDELKLTTRDIPNYSKLMQTRLQILQAHNLKINVCYQTFASIVFAFICIFIQAIVFKKSEVPYLNIILLIFVWPMFIEMLCRGLELNIIAWLLSILPVIIVIIYNTVTYINDKKDKDKKDKEKDYDKKERLNEQYEIMDILNYY